METFKPTITIPEKIAGIAFWAEVSSTDEIGITVDGVKEGDILEIQDISGICSFAKSNNKLLAGLVGITAGILQDGISYYTDNEGKEVNNAISAESKALREKLSKDVKIKRRDGYGQDPGTGDFAKHEGGIIVCMPEAKGCIYASSDYYLKDGAEKNGRKPEYYSDKLKEKNSFFPYRDGDNLILSAMAKTDGTIHLLCFDSKFADNGGSYTMKFMITRKNDPVSSSKIRQILLEQIGKYSG